MNTSTFTALSLKLIGAIFILSSLIDYISLAIPFNWQERSWQIGLVTSLVDRGIVPMVGMALVLIGYWIEASSGVPPRKSSGFDLRLPTFILASLLALLFLLLVPLHVSNLNQAKTTALEQIEKGAGQGQQQIQGFLAQLNTLSQNPQLLNQQIAQRNQVIETGQFQGRQVTAEELENLRQQRDQLQQLRDLAKTPEEFKKRVNDIKNQLETRLLEQRSRAENQAKIQALKQGLRIGLSSLMLAIGYAVIGWFGLRGMGGSASSRPKTSPR